MICPTVYRFKLVNPKLLVGIQDINLVPDS